jgi:predicted Fe-S protein YdhL (DUF1289 family)
MKKPSQTSPKPRASRTKKPSGPTQWEICKQLAQHFEVAPQSVKSWFASGCPRVFDEAVQWKTQRDADRAIRSVSGRPNRLLKVIEGKTEAAQADDLMPLSELSETFGEAVSLVVELRKAGITTTRLAEITGFSTPVIKRVCHEHPDLRPKKQAAVSWSLARSLAVDRLIDALDSEESSRKMSASQLAVVAGVCSDKLRDLEQPTESSVINIRAKIEALSFEELINSIPKQADTIDGEFSFEPAREEPLQIEEGS